MLVIALAAGCASDKSAIDELKRTDEDLVDRMQYPAKSEDQKSADTTDKEKLNVLGQESKGTETVDVAGKQEPTRKIILDEKDATETGVLKEPIESEPPLPEELRKVREITLNFENTDVYEVITIIAELLKINYIIEGEITGKITLQTFRKIPVRHLYSVLEQILAVNGITVVKSGNFYRFIPLKEAPQKPTGLRFGLDSTGTSGDRVIIQLIPLQNQSPGAIKATLAPLISKNGIILDVPETNILMVIDLATVVEQIVQLTKALDTHQIASSDIQLFTLFHSEAETVAEELNQIFKSIGYKNAVEKSIKFLPLARINSILVINAVDKADDRIEFWVEKLDQPIAEGKLSTYVYYIQNAEAENLASLLEAIFNEKEEGDEPVLPTEKTQTSAPKKPESKKGPENKLKKISSFKDRLQIEGGLKTSFSGPVQFIPDTNTNSLIVRTQSKNYSVIMEIIKKLDLLPQQVLIEVLIMDLTLDDETRTGIEWAMKGTLTSKPPDQGGKIIGGGGAPSVSTLGSQIGNTATSLFAPGASFFVQQKDKFIGLLQAFASDSKINIVANPILITSDNKEADIAIVDDIPIQSTTITTPTAGQPLTQTTIEYRSVGVKLGIMPKINSDNFVNLKIDQEISNLGPTIQNVPSFTTRTMKTEVVLKDNQILVMGGLMRTTVSKTKEGIPGLMEIPYLGRLFSNQVDSTQKTELMLFIIPHIISNTEDSKFVTQQFKNKIKTLKSQIFMNGEDDSENE